MPNPFSIVTAGRALAVNGEIYNHVALRDALKLPHVWRTKSDCEIILYLYDEYGSALCNMLSGIFAFALFDERSGRFLRRPRPHRHSSALHRMGQRRRNLRRERNESSRSRMREDPRSFRRDITTAAKPDSSSDGMIHNGRIHCPPRRCPCTSSELRSKLRSSSK